MTYSRTIQFVLVSIWAIGSLVLAWFVRRRKFVCFGSVALAVPGIAYSTIGYGLLELGGIVHALAAGVYALPCHYFFQRSRERKRG